MEPITIFFKQDVTNYTQFPGRIVQQFLGLTQSNPNLIWQVQN